MLMLLAACSGEAPLPQGGAPRIVSLNPCSDAILADIAPGALVGISHYSHDPRSTSMSLAQARRYPAVSGSVEEVLALRPDVVVASTFLPPATARALERLGIRVERVGIAPRIADSVAQVRALATLAHSEAAGERLVGRIENNARAPEAERPTALVWQAGEIVAGSGSLVAQMLERAGFANHAAALGLGQGAYLPLEQVLADPPDVIIAAGGERALTHPALQELGGVQYATLDPALLYCGGPTVPKLATRLAEIRADLP